MNGFILGIKGDMEQAYNAEGKRIPTTYIHTKPCYIVDIKTKPDASLHSVMLGFWQAKTISKPVSGKLKKAGITAPLRFLKEIKLSSDISLIEKDGKKGIKKGESEFYIGDEIKPSSVFQIGELVQVTGVSKGKGFAGVVKRHKFAGGPRTHGQSDRERAPGSIGSGTTPGRINKGKRMAGRMGGETVTVKNLQVYKSLDDVLIVKGLVPGSKNNLVIVK